MLTSKNSNLLNFFSAKSHTPILKTANQISKQQKPVDRSRIEKMLAAKKAKRELRQQLCQQLAAGGEGGGGGQLQAASSSNKKPKGQPLPRPHVITAMSGISRVPQGHGTHKKYSVTLRYLDELGGKHTKSIFFGSWDKNYFAENEDHEDESLRFSALQRLKFEDHPLHKDFYVSRILSRKGVNNIDAACLLTCKELVHNH